MEEEGTELVSTGGFVGLSDSSDEEINYDDEVALLPQFSDQPLTVHQLLKTLKTPLGSASTCPTKSGVVFKQRNSSIIQWKKKYAVFRANEHGQPSIYYYKSVEDAEVL